MRRLRRPVDDDSRPAGSRPDAADDVAALESMVATRSVVPPRLRGHFTVRYVCALLLVAGLATIACLSVSKLVDTQNSAAAQVNVAGRQRMLSQRIALQAGLLVASTGASREALRATMSADIEAMSAGQRGLLGGDASRNLPGDPAPAVAQLYRGGTQAAVDRYVAAARLLVRPDGPDPAGVNALQAQAVGPLLVSLDQIVQAYQRESEARIARIQRDEQILLALTLLTLAFEALVVFRPMSHRIERETRRLEDSSARYRGQADRHAFSLRLRDAVDLADTETDLVDTVLQAVSDGGVPGVAELLMTDDDGGLVARPAPSRHACSVTTTQGCPALRRSRTMMFADSGALGACAHLRGDNSGRPVAGTCVPVTFLGTGIGVLRTVTDAGTTLTDLTRETIETVASTAGAHVGTLRALAMSRSDAESDPLTGLLNRRGLEKAVARLESQRSPYAVIVADLDHFKAINDTYGHDQGDVVLTDVARMLTAALRPGDILARHGGEEFVAVLPLSGEGLGPGQGLAAGLAVAERMRRLLADRHLRDDGPACTASLGVAGPDTCGLDDALRRADAALYRAKESGRNRVEVSGDVVGQVPADLVVG